MKKRNTRRGFTLIELLVVVLIIGILAAVALPQYQKAVLKTRVSELQLAISNLEKAVDLYALEKGAPSGETDIDLLPSLDLDYTGAFTYNEAMNNGSYCDAKKVCLSARYEKPTFLVCAEPRQKSGFSGAPDYYLCSKRASASSAWNRTYHSCDTNIDNLGLDVFGYQSAGC